MCAAYSYPVRKWERSGESKTSEPALDFDALANGKRKRALPRSFADASSSSSSAAGGFKTEAAASVEASVQAAEAQTGPKAKSVRLPLRACQNPNVMRVLMDSDEEDEQQQEPPRVASHVTSDPVLMQAQRIMSLARQGRNVVVEAEAQAAALSRMQQAELQARRAREEELRRQATEAEARRRQELLRQAAPTMPVPTAGTNLLTATDSGGGSMVAIKTRTNGQHEKMWKIRASDPFAKLIDVYCTTYGVAAHEARFMFDGVAINPQQSPASLDMEDEDLIDVVIPVARYDQAMLALQAPAQPTVQAQPLPSLMSTVLAATTAPSSSIVAVKTRTNGQHEKMWKIRASDPFAKLIDVYCTTYGVAAHEARFMFDGVAINPQQSPASLDMEDEDLIDVVIPAARYHQAMLALQAQIAAAQQQQQLLPSKDRNLLNLTIRHRITGPSELELRLRVPRSHTVTDLAKTVAEQLQVSAHEITFQVLPTSTQADPTLQELKIADNTVLTARRLLQVHVALPGVRLPAQVKIFADMCVEETLWRLAAAAKVPANRVVLVYNSRCLSGTETFQAAGVVDGSQLAVMVKP